MRELRQTGWLAYKVVYAPIYNVYIYIYIHNMILNKYIYIYIHLSLPLCVYIYIYRSLSLYTYITYLRAAKLLASSSSSVWALTGPQDSSKGAAVEAGGSDECDVIC